MKFDLMALNETFKDFLSYNTSSWREHKYQIHEDSSPGNQIVPIDIVNVEIFHKINENFDLLVALQQKLHDHQCQQDSSSGNNDVLYKSDISHVNLYTELSLHKALANRASLYYQLHVLKVIKVLILILK